MYCTPRLAPQETARTLNGKSSLSALRRAECTPIAVRPCGLSGRPRQIIAYIVCGMHRGLSLQVHRGRLLPEGLPPTSNFKLQRHAKSWSTQMTAAELSLKLKRGASAPSSVALQTNSPYSPPPSPPLSDMPDTSSFTFQSGHLGLLLRDCSDCVLIAEVEAGGQGDALGVMPESVIIGVNGEQVSGLSQAELIEKVHQSPRPLTLHVLPQQIVHKRSIMDA